jgi:hypothetical protein
MPIIGTVASQLIARLGPAAATYLQRAFFSSNATDGFTSLRDSTGNTYYSGTSGALGTNGYYASVVMKFDNLGVFVWGKYWTNQGYSCTICFDGSGNIVVQSNENSRQLMLLKLSAIDGSVVTSPVYWGTGVAYRSGVGMDNLGQFWNAGSTNPTSVGAGLAMTSSAFGTLTTYRVGGEYGDGLFIDGSDIYFGGTDSSSNGYRGGTTKITSSGAFQWSKYFGANYSTSSPDAIATDSSGGVYVAAWQTDSGFTGGSGYLIKWDSSGNLEWQRNFDSGGTLDSLSGVCVDRVNGFVYACGTTSTSPSTGIIVKYNLSGTLQWQRKLSNSNFYSVKLTSNGELMLSGSWKGLASGPSSQTLLIRVPADGSKTGTYTVGGTSVTYTTGTLTVTTSSQVSGTFASGLTSNTYEANSTSLVNFNDYSASTQVVTI